jgi:hypothetical protein
MTVTKPICLLAAMGLMLVVAGCATPPVQVAQKGDMLAAAGFQVRVADSPHRVAQMNRLPPNKDVTRIVTGVFAQPPFRAFHDQSYQPVPVSQPVARRPGSTSVQT